MLSTCVIFAGISLGNFDKYRRGRISNISCASDGESIVDLNSCAITLRGMVNIVFDSV
jgi:hypothetical protein